MSEVFMFLMFVRLFLTFNWEILCLCHPENFRSLSLSQDLRRMCFLAADLILFWHPVYVNNIVTVLNRKNEKDVFLLFLIFDFINSTIFFNIFLPSHCWIFRNADRAETLSSLRMISQLNQMPENSIYVPYVCKTFFDLLAAYSMSELL